MLTHDAMQHLVLRLAAPPRPARGAWTYLVVGVALLVVGFGLMSLVMYLR